ncbi:hypothetical protein K491DRAFT_182829 [Lophiostoma macrostomum CBS 122681]|uniref:CENP-V/GFA domain-containing protein n=1 Tax=Lophiostoma macrostomum CBS 122681 TaxID=1314788 RepID=A0A6A6TR78_9PLEO|nr:hypothetical protein K491DRAFT_182829 [Lophiostoma macrostomum CBS 122681]
MASSEGITTLTVDCLCKGNTYPIDVPTSKLPLAGYMCHCNKCRHMTGGLYSPHIILPAPQSAVSFAGLSEYPFSDNANSYFCPTCSTPLFFNWQREQTKLWGIMVGALQNDPGDLVKFTTNAYVSDTIDGGASMWLRKPNTDDSEARRFEERSTGPEIPPDWPAVSSFTGYEKKLEDEVPVRCLCNGVRFVMKRGNYEGNTKDELPWFIDPKTHKQIANFCACDSCRLFSGVDIFNWTYAELNHITCSDGTPLPGHVKGLKELVDSKDPSIGTLKYYTSRSDVQRYFCEVCSGSIFYAVDSRPEHVDVAIGAIEASDGARAEGLLSWDFGNVMQSVDADGGWRENLMKRVKEESEWWRIERGYPKNWRRAQREEKEKAKEKYTDN